MRFIGLFLTRGINNSGVGTDRELRPRERAYSPTPLAKKRSVGHFNTGALSGRS
ncbi:MAG TPA: hypothetical protein VFV34_05740 [Blastocatellia bacterium]|nr:hypothetical protein [Blastocatellia bacterium]